MGKKILTSNRTVSSGRTGKFEWHADTAVQLNTSDSPEDQNDAAESLFYLFLLSLHLHKLNIESTNSTLRTTQSCFQFLQLLNRVG